MRVNEQGRSMIEMLGVLAIVGVLSVGGIAGYSKAMNKFKTNKISDQVQMISTNIRTLFSSQRTYEGLNNGMALQAGLIPGEMYDAVSSGGSYSNSYPITNAFGGSVVIAVADQSNTGDMMAFTIGFSQIPQSACVSIATTDWGGDAGSGLAAMYIEGHDAGDDTDGASAADAGTQLSTPTSGLTASTNIHIPGDEQHGLPFSIIDANAACNLSLNAVSWKYF